MSSKTQMGQFGDGHEDAAKVYQNHKKGPATIWIFSRNDYYTLYGDDAEMVASEIRGTKEGILNVGEKKVPRLSMSLTQFKHEVRTLILQRQYRVVMWTKQNREFEKQFESSPGNLGPLEEVLYSASDNLASRGLIVISCINKKVGQPDFGITYIDTICKTIQVVFFTDDSYLTTLESLLVQLSPREALTRVPDKGLNEEVQRKLKLNQVMVTPYNKKGTSELDSLLEQLTNLCTKNMEKSQIRSILDSAPSQDMKKVIQESVVWGIEYLKLLTDQSKHHSFDMSLMKVSNFIKVDSAAVSSLNLFPEGTVTSRNNDNQKHKSLFGLLNNCRTHMGQRLLSKWIRQPLKDLGLIDDRHNLVEHFVEETDVRIDLYDRKLRKIPDLLRLSNKFAIMKAELSDCHAVYLVLKELPNIIQLTGDQNMYVRTTFTEPLERFRKKMKKLSDMVEEVIDFEILSREREFRVQRKFDEDLNKAGEELNRLEGKMNKIHTEVAHDLKIDPKHLKCNKDTSVGFSFSLTNKFEKQMRQKKDLIELNCNKKDGIKFTTARMKDLSTLYLESRKDYDENVAIVMKMIRETASGYSVHIRDMGNLLAHLDVIVSLSVAATSAHIPYVRPIMKAQKEKQLSLTKLRHPCLEATGIDFISNDVDFTQKRFYLVTGPNMGGKSTFIRSVGIAVLMAQMGSFVPAEEAVISVVDGIYTRIGASDKQLQGNSTFMTEMVETAAILKSATEHSLIIIDELGRGTSTFDGYGLAWAVSRLICLDIKSCCLFATHYHELSYMESEEGMDCVGNLHVAVYEDKDKDEVTMMYQVLPGWCTRSYGLKVARTAHFPDHMIGFAEEKLEQYEAMDKMYNSRKAQDIKRLLDQCDQPQDMTKEEINKLVNGIQEILKIQG